MRGTFVYLLLFTILRILRREAEPLALRICFWWCSLPMRRRTQRRVSNQNGRVMKKHLRQELITEEELLSQLRQQGVQNPAELKRCYLEGNGHFSVIALV